MIPEYTYNSYPVNCKYRALASIGLSDVRKLSSSFVYLFDLYVRHFYRNAKFIEFYIFD